MTSWKYAIQLQILRRSQILQCDINNNIVIVVINSTSLFFFSQSDAYFNSLTTFPGSLSLCLSLYLLSSFQIHVTKILCKVLIHVAIKVIH